MITLILPNNKILGPVSTVFFDKDGTLIDSHSYWGEIIKERARVILSFYRIDENKFDDICNCMGFCNQSQRLLVKGPIALESRNVVVEHLISYLRSIGKKGSPKEINDIFDLVTANMNSKKLPDIILIPKAVSLLLDLIRQGVKVAIITSDSTANTINFLAKVGLAQEQVLLVTRDNYPHAKKTGLPANHAAETIGVKISDCLIIGDAPMDYEMAKNSGASHLLVSTGQLPSRILLKHSSNVVNSLSEIKFIST